MLYSQKFCFYSLCIFDIFLFVNVLNTVAPVFFLQKRQMPFYWKLHTILV